MSGLTVLSFAAVVSGMALLPRQQPEVLCDGSRFPKLEDCETLSSVWSADLGASSDFFEGQPCNIYVSVTHDLNCMLTACQAPGHEDVTSFPHQLAYDSYVEIRETCIFPQNAGGLCNPGDQTYQFQAFNDPDFNPERRRKVLDQGDFEVIPASREEVAKLADKAAAKNQQQVEKRQQDGDDSASITVISQNVIAPNSRQAVTGRLPAGSSYTISETDTFSVGITTSFSLEAGFFDIFSASAGLDISTDYSVANTQGLTVVVQCENGQQGTIFWTPLSTRYQGNWNPSGDAFDVYIPIESSADSYAVECIG
ncbi:hypothetical protein CC79DRAFT_1353321 [Sarocladium strictum]